jgi:hypothetical protein
MFVGLAIASHSEGLLFEDHVVAIPEGNRIWPKISWFRLPRPSGMLPNSC